MKVVRVDWVDSHDVQGWVHLNDIAAIEPQPITTVGILLGESDQAIRITAHYGHPNRADGAAQVCGAMTIPRCAILGITELGEIDDVAAEPAE